MTRRRRIEFRATGTGFAGGGITPLGSDRRLKMRRNAADGNVVESDAQLQDPVKADDVIFVKEALF